MGNSPDNRVNLLAKNWVQINSNTYKNTITQELIDSYDLQARNEEELSYNNSLLIKRAAINHPNVLKLIYFYQEQQSIVVCNNKKFKYKIYTEHASGTLASLIGVERSEGDLCYCCSVMSGIGCLVEKYGYFGVSPTMIFMVNSVGLSRIDQKKTAKVWVNQDLRVNYTEQICNEQEMCFHLFELFQLLVQRDLCSKIDVKEMSNQRRFKDFFQYIFKTHKKEPSEGKVQRKRVSSQLNGFEANKIQKNVVFTQPMTKTNLAIKHTNTFPTNNSSRQSLVHVVNNSLNLEKEPIASEKNQLDTSYRNGFMKKDVYAVKEVDLQNRSFQKIEKNKVNFSYTDSLATPKNNKNFKEIKTAKIVQSPHEELASVYFRSNKNKGQFEKMPARRESLPVVSFFNSKSKPQTVKTTHLIKKSPEFKEIKNDKNLNQSVQAYKNQQKTVLKKPTELEIQTNLQQPLPAKSVLKEDFSESKAKKQNNLKLQKCIDLQCTGPVLQSPKKSIGSSKHKSTGGFQIAKEYCLSIEPEIKMPSIRIDQSEQFVSESVEISSGNNLRGKGDNLTSNFYRESHPEREESVSSEQVNINPINLVHPHLREGSSRKGSLPAPTLDKKYNSYVHKLQHFSKGIANSINSNGTKRSLPQENHETQMVNQNQLRAANMEKKDYLGSNMAMYHNKGEIRNKRSSDIDSYYSESESLDQRKKVQILQKISNTQKILQQNKKKLQKLQLQKDLQIQKDMIKKEMESLLKNNMMVDESHRIKQKVKHKKATFAELKAEAAKILNDLNL